MDFKVNWPRYFENWNAQSNKLSAGIKVGENFLAFTEQSKIEFHYEIPHHLITVTIPQLQVVKPCTQLFHASKKSSIVYIHCISTRGQNGSEFARSECPSHHGLFVQTPTGVSGIRTWWCSTITGMYTQKPIGSDCRQTTRQKASKVISKAW